ncbi:MAG TPA: hypothetical protein VGW12_18670 [Pyrinomonadaceae bacterium]|nr:hypothetical protein [Pyrinomonadaceae bacterium]
MSCCTGKPRHAAGDCATVSCHVEFPDRAAATDDSQGDAHQEQHAPPLHTTGHEAHAAYRQSQAQHAAQAHHAAPVETPQAETHPASHSDTHTASHAETLSASHRSETENAAEPETERTNRAARRVAARASVARPCPLDCGTTAGSFSNNLRPRDAATPAQARRLRPPTRAATRGRFSALSQNSTDRRRLSPPRAPPVAL